MSNTNLIVLIGRIGQAPDVKHTENATIATLSLATNRRQKQGDSYIEKTDWHRVVCFNQSARYLESYADKGSLISVEGRLQSRSYEADGETKYITEVIANRVNILATTKPKEETQSDYSASYNAQKSGAFDDDIPF